MAALTTTRAGNWFDTGGGTTPWTALTGAGPGGVPGVGDTVTISHAVTITTGQTASVGTSPQNIATTVCSIGSAGTLTISGTGELQCYGNFNGVGAGASAGTSRLIIQDTAWLTMMSSANVTTPNRYLITAGTGNTQSFRVDCNGTSIAAPCGIRSDLSTSFWNHTGYASVTGQFGKFINGTSGNATDAGCWQGGAYPHPGSIYNLTDWVFDNCGQISVGGTPSSPSTCTLTRVTFQNTGSLVRWNWVPKSANVVWTFDGLVLDAPQGQTQTSVSELRAQNIIMISTGLTATHLAPGGASTTVDNAICVAQHAGVLGGYGGTTVGNVKNVLLWMRSSLCKILSADTSTDVITLDKTHQFTNGAQVDFCDTYGGAPVPGGLIAGADVGVQYFVRSESATTITVYDTSAHAIAGGATGKYNITSTGTGSVSLINPHFSGGATDTSARIFVLEGVGKGGDLSNGPSGSTVMAMKNNISLASARGISPGVMCSPLNVSGTYTVNAEHNTAFSTNGGLFHSGESVPGHSGTYDSMRSNIALVRTAEGGDPQQAIYTNEDTTNANKVVAANAGWNIVHGGGTAYDTLGEVYDLANQANPVATNDQYNIDCDFINENIGILDWASWWGTRLGLSGDGLTTPGAQSTYENAVLLLKNAYNGVITHAEAVNTPSMMINYLRRGMIPRLASIRVTGHDGLTPGAYGAWAPALSAQTATASLGNVTTNCGDGTLYWIISTISTAPDWDRIILGKDSTGTTVASGFSGNQAVSASGVQNITLSGATLSPATNYYLHVAHEADATANGDAAQASYLRLSETVTSAAFQAGASVPLFMHNTFMRSAA